MNEADHALFERRLMAILVMCAVGGTLFGVFGVVVAIGGRDGAIVATVVLSIAAGWIYANQPGLWDKKRKLYIRASADDIRALMEQTPCEKQLFVSSEKIFDTSRVTLVVECLEGDQ